MEDLNKQISNEDNNIIIGFGMGGYYAAWLTNNCMAIPGVLLNPWIFPKDIINNYYAANVPSWNNPANSYKSLERL